MKTLGVSGSPIANSNTDRAIKAVLQAAGGDNEFIKLTDYTVAPCKACLGCLHTNRCVIEDDGIELAEKTRESDALVIGGFTPYSTIDARTKAFIERLYPLRHHHGYMAGKPGAAVVTSAVPEENEALPPACQTGVNAIRFYMMEEGMEFLGAVKIQGNVPCTKCGRGDTCAMSGVTMLYGQEATVDSVGIRIFEEQPLALRGVEQLGRRLRETLAAR